MGWWDYLGEGLKSTKNGLGCDDGEKCARGCPGPKDFKLDLRLK